MICQDEQDKTVELPTLNIEELKKLAIDQAMKKYDGCVTKAAKELGIGRATLYRILKEGEKNHERK